MIEQNTIEKLITLYKGDEKMLGSIRRSIGSFEEYHTAIFEMELWMKVYSKVVGREEYQENVTRLDQMRTMSHNAVLGSVRLLNRLADRNNLPPVYDGIVSEERPYRREVADAVLEYVENVIRTRR